MSNNWSASRLSTFKACPLKYYYSYIKQFDSNIPVNTELADKGLLFHQIAEEMDNSKTFEDLLVLLEEKNKEFKVDLEKYPEKIALKRFLHFWQDIVMPKLDEGFTLKKEGWTRGIIEGKQFVGALDLSLYKYQPIGVLKEAIIFDYKSAKTAAASSYKNQLVLYAYLIGKENNFTNQQIVENIKLYVFFPFSEQKKETEQDNMLASLKRVNYTLEDLERIISENQKTIIESENIDWEYEDKDKLAKPNFTCRFCQYLGTIPDTSIDFNGCKCTYNQGYRQVRGLKFHLREQKK